MKPPSRTHSIGTKVTEEEFTRLQACAAERGLSVSEWCREVLLDSTNNTHSSPTEQIVLAEVIALRTIVANLIYAFTSDGKVTRDQMVAFIERADKSKLKRAADLLSQLSKHDDPLFTPQKPGKEGQ
jgi:hypothetical protein